MAMRRRHSPFLTLPRVWLMTDSRMGDALLPAIKGLPKGAGIVFRHYDLAPKARRALFDQVRAITRRRHILLLLAGSPKLAKAWGADGSHGRHRGATTAPVHNVPERIKAERSGTQLLFVSPVFATQSHPGARTFGPVRFGLLIRGTKRPVIALGGITRPRAAQLRGFGIYGWAGIDAFRT
jgi:thiamine-phosphate pyrophosphorylase